MSSLLRQERIAKLYTTGISVIGVSLLVGSIALRPDFSGNASLTVLLSLAAVACIVQVASFLSDIFEEVAISITSPIALATAAVFGVAAVPFVTFAGALGIVIKVHQQKKRSYFENLKSLAFNLGMLAIAGVIGGAVAVWFDNQFEFLGSQLFGWLVAAFLITQINALMLSVVIALHAPKTTVSEAYRQNSWAIQQDVAMTVIGGPLLAVALLSMGALGLAVVILPLVLSTLSFRNYVNRTEEQMEQLEERVKERTAELQTANDNLEALAKQKGQFLAVLSHDMKTPLSAIRLYTQLMQRSPDIPAERRLHMLETILHSENTLTDMVKNIVEIERLQLGAEPELEYRHHDVARLLDEACATIRPLAEKKAISLTAVPASTPILMYGDDERLRRVFENLLSNAVKYTPAEGRIHVWTVHNEEQIKIHVMDTGYGIPPEDLDEIFAPYHRVKENEQHASGTGLGLAVVQNFVELHGGHVGVSSEVGSGSTFVVTLPLHGRPNGDALPIEDDFDDDYDFAVPANPFPPDSRPSSRRHRQTV